MNRIVDSTAIGYVLDDCNAGELMRADTHRLTADDVEKLLRERPGVYGYELVNGELVELMPNSLPHGRVAARLSAEIDTHLRQHGGGRVYVEAGFVLPLAVDSERLRFPDIAYVSAETLATRGGEPETGYARFAPDFTIEIDSPSNTEEDVLQKVQDYLDAGVRLGWVIHVRSRSATVYHPDGSARLLREHDALDGEDLLPGLSIPLRSVLD
ncbi:MAG: Uma2 family endonuclease [Gemmatimonadetes bacterium]|nr:Uma2 family endonuclease [Gemmatimonadota bacterium]